MKSKIFSIISLMLILMFTGCSNQDEVNTECMTEFSEMKTHVNNELLSQVKADIVACVGKTTRSATDSITLEGQEPMIRQALQPLVPVGKSLRDEVVKSAQDDGIELTSEEIEQFENMSDEDLAAFAFVWGELEQINQLQSVSSVNAPKPDNKDEEKGVTKDDMLDCLSVAVGFGVVSGLHGYIEGTREMMTLASAAKIGSKLLGRALGWIGVAIAVYEYVDCLQGKKAKKDEK